MAGRYYTTKSGLYRSYNNQRLSEQEIKELLADIAKFNEAGKNFQVLVDAQVKMAIQNGVANTRIASALGVTEAAVRLKAKRRGWVDG